MPVVTCPQCPTKLKIPDGVSGNTRCPKCGTVFPVAPAPAFEVVDAPAPKPAAPRPAPKPAPKAAAMEPDFEVVDEKPKKRVTADEDDDEPRPARPSGLLDRRPSEQPPRGSSPDRAKPTLGAAETARPSACSPTHFG